ncbi:hypothetical protein M0R45_022631 [Rubus argutus]|uniref:Uncharacterized protein n=1 Tax=Rubus argutus TaxID=59490 RepID=A0AAW1XGP7_RUBAR
MEAAAHSGLRERARRRGVESCQTRAWVLERNSIYLHLRELMSSLDNGCSKKKSRRRPVGGRRCGGRTSTVRVKVKKLQMLVPGGSGLEAERLFLHTADYIMHLRLQVNVLQALSKIYKL